MFEILANKNMKVSSFKSGENIQKKEDVPDCTVYFLAQRLQRMNYHENKSV